eukprot:jgi/Astpho2/8159/e_gw1.00120.202.1_t
MLTPSGRLGGVQRRRPRCSRCAARTSGTRRPRRSAAPTGADSLTLRSIHTNLNQMMS